MKFTEERLMPNIKYAIFSLADEPGPLGPAGRNPFVRFGIHFHRSTFTSFVILFCIPAMTRKRHLLS